MGGKGSGRRKVIKDPLTRGTELKTYRDYCLSIIDKAEKVGLMKELVLLMNVFRIMFQVQIYKVDEPTPALHLGQEEEQYSKGSE